MRVAFVLNPLTGSLGAENFIYFLMLSIRMLKSVTNMYIKKPDPNILRNTGYHTLDFIQMLN